MPKVADFQRVNRTIWLGMAIILVFDLMFVADGTFTVVWKSYAVGAVTVSALMALSVVYRTVRPDPNVVLTLESAAQLIAFPLIGAPVSYIAATMNMPWQDDLFASVDRAMGFDWRAMLDLVNAHPTAHQVLVFAYKSFLLQAATAVIVLGPLGKAVQLKSFLIAFMLGALVTIAISSVLPAQGTWAHYGLSLADSPSILPTVRDTHLHTLHGLRDGTERIFVGGGAEGIITFPSFHAALALILIFTFWSVRYLRWVALVLNSLMILATPVDGSHYLADVLAGFAVAIVCWIVARAFIERSLAARPAAMAAPAFARSM